jgi:hypothetical protein
MISITDNFKQNLLSGNIAVGYFCLIALPTPIRFTTFDVDILSGANTYVSYPMVVGKLELSLSDSSDYIDIQLSNIGDVFYSAIFDSSGFAGTRLQITLGLLDITTKAFIGTLNVFDGKINSFKINDKFIKITVSSNLSNWNKQIPFRTTSALCYKVFKSTLCGYTGAQTLCNRSWDRCNVLGNTDNFGGFKFMPAILRERLKWGMGSGA